MEYISINFGEKINLMESEYANISEGKYELSFLNYNLEVSVQFTIGLLEVTFSVYDKNKKLIKSKKYVENLELQKHIRFISLEEFRAGFLLFFNIIKIELLNQKKYNYFKGNMLIQATAKDILFYERVEIFVFNDKYIFVCHTKEEKVHDIFVGNEDDCQQTAYDVKFDSSIDYLLSNEHHPLEDKDLLELLYLKGE